MIHDSDAPACEEKLLQKALFRISIMREWKKILHKWKEAGTFVPARMKKKNIYKKDSSSFYSSLYPINMNKI